MNVLIVDDEKPARERLRHLLAELPDIETVGEAADGLQALENLARQATDVVLLDIRMPELDGLAVARQLASQPRPPAVIFVTAYGEHALEAFETHAVDYLVKPVRGERLAKALQAARRLTRAQLQALSDAPPKGRQQLLARVAGKTRLVAIEDVLFFRAEDKYVSVHHLGGEFVIEDALKGLEEEFGARFVRIHRNALVAVAAVVGLEKTAHGHQLLLKDGTRLDVSRRHVRQVKALLAELQQA